MDDFLGRIDQMTELACGWCKTPLAEDSPALDFCSPQHQALWTAQHGKPLAKCSSVEVLVDIDLSGFARSLERAMESASRVVVVWGRAFAKTLRATAEVEASFAHLVAQCWPTGEEAEHPPDPREQRMQAALEARRNRNTGPKQVMRVPKRLDGKARR